MTTSITPSVQIVVGFIVFIIGFYMLIKYYNGNFLSPQTLSAVAFLLIGAAFIWPEIDDTMKKT